MLVEVTANWCGGCKQMKPILHNIAQEYNESMSVYTLDYDQVSDINSIPTFMMIKNGKQQGEEK